MSFSDLLKEDFGKVDIISDMKEVNLNYVLFHRRDPDENVIDAIFIKDLEEALLDEKNKNSELVLNLAGVHSRYRLIHDKDKGHYLRLESVKESTEEHPFSILESDFYRGLVYMAYTQ